jgi:hypothetical protein
MSILILIALGVCFSTSVLFIVLYVNIRKKYTKIDSNLQKKSVGYSNLLEAFNKFKKEMTSNKKGYYEATINLMSPEAHKNGLPGEPYKCLFYIKELDRYTNGMSKIELTEIEVVSGFDHYQFDHVKKTMKNQFSSLKKTTDIEWLESEDSIKELRKQKLEKISGIDQN